VILLSATPILCFLGKKKKIKATIQGTVLEGGQQLDGSEKSFPDTTENPVCRVPMFLWENDRKIVS
jgi:hypothetical protein